MNVILNRLNYVSVSEDSLNNSDINQKSNKDLKSQQYASSSGSSVDFVKLYRGKEGIGLFEPSLPRFTFFRNEAEDPATKFTKISDVGNQHVGKHFDEAMTGLTMASSRVKFVEKDKILFREPPIRGSLSNKVKLVSGGKGNWSDFIGRGMLTCAVMGTGGAPKPRVIFVAIRELSKSDQAGIIAIVPSNFEDELNWGTAVAKAQERGMKVLMIPVADAVCSSGCGLERKGHSGVLLYFKIAGAMAEANHSLTQIYNKLWDLSVSTVSCRIMNNSFHIDQHSTNLNRKSMIGPSKEETVREMVRLITDPNEETSLAFEPDSKLMLLVNAYSGNWYFLNSIGVEAVNQFLEKNLQLEKVYCGFYLAQEDLGFSLTLMAGLDDDIIRWLGDYTSSPGWTYPGTGRISIAIPRDDVLDKKDDRIPDDIAQGILSVLKAIFPEAASSKDILNSIDENGEYGTKFSTVALQILSGLDSNELDPSQPYNCFLAMSEYFLTVFNNSDGIMYALFLIGFSQAFQGTLDEKECDNKKINKKTWILALKTGIMNIESYFMVDFSDGTIVDILGPIYFLLRAAKFENSLTEALDVASEIALEKYKRAKECYKRITTSTEATLYGAYILAKAFTNHVKSLLLTIKQDEMIEDAKEEDGEVKKENIDPNYHARFGMSINEHLYADDKAHFVLRTRRKSSLEASPTNVLEDKSKTLKRTQEKGDIFQM